MQSAATLTGHDEQFSFREKYARELGDATEKNLNLGSSNRLGHPKNNPENANYILFMRDFQSPARKKCEADIEITLQEYILARTFSRGDCAGFSSVALFEGLKRGISSTIALIRTIALPNKCALHRFVVLDADITRIQTNPLFRVKGYLVDRDERKLINSANEVSENKKYISREISEGKVVINEERVEDFIVYRVNLYQNLTSEQWLWFIKMLSKFEMYVNSHKDEFKKLYKENIPESKEINIDIAYDRLLLTIEVCKNEFALLAINPHVSKTYSELCNPVKDKKQSALVANALLSPPLTASTTVSSCSPSKISSVRSLLYEH